MASLGNAVTIGAVPGHGILRSPSESIYDGVVVVTDWMVELPVSVWPTLAEGTTVTVDGVAYVAREHGRIGTDQSTLFVPLEVTP